MKQTHSFRPILAMMVICAFVGCNTTGGEDPGPVADIIRIEQEPLEISPTDTVKFTMIVAKKRQQKVSYSWSFGGKGVHLNGVLLNPGRDNYISTDSTIIYWTPAGEKGVIFGEARILPSNNSYDVSMKFFTFTVVE